MKKNFLTGMAIVCLVLLIHSCQKQSESPNPAEQTEVMGKKPAPQPSGSSCLNYAVTLTRTYADGKTTFVWKIVNPNPGNGTNGTLQNLSHWGFIPGCAGNNGLEQNWSDLLSAAYSYDQQTWTSIIPTPSLQPDPSQSCLTGNVFKFAMGTSGAAATYYQVVLQGNYGTESIAAVFKSGANTGCCVKEVPGIGCKQEESCSFSQGFYFASPAPWPAATVEVAGFTYTEAEGRAIWNCSNAGGIADSKKAFTQVASLKLSGAYPTGNASIDADVVTIETWLSGLGKLVACSNLPTGNSAVGEAAGRIGLYINENHCQ